MLDINNYEIKELLEENSVLTKIMILEKSKNIEELKINTEKIVSKVCGSKEYNQEQKTLLLNIIENTLKNIVEEEKIIEYKNKLKGEKNMLALYEMVEEEKMNSYRDGMLEGKLEGVKMIAIKMLKMKIEKNTIIKVTGLKEEELEKLKK